MRKTIESFFTLVFLLGPIMTSAQTSEEFWTLVINDQSGEVAISKVGDKAYIDVRRLAQIARGSISFEGNRLVLDVPCSSNLTEARQSGSEQATDSRLSGEFTKAAIEEISLMREWASTLANAIQNGYPVTESWVANYRARAQSGLDTTSAAASTDADRKAFQLLHTEFGAVQGWSAKLLEARKSLGAANYALSPGSLQNDPLSKKIVSCAHFLGQMLASSSFQDDPTCH